MGAADEDKDPHQEAAHDLPLVRMSVLESGPLGLEGEACLEFWYLEPVTAGVSELRILLESSAGLEEIWASPSLSRDFWRQVFVPLSIIEPGTQVMIEATPAASTEGGFTVNRIGVRRGSCGNQCESSTELWTDESTRCHCSAGQLLCSPSPCPEGQICAPQRGGSSGPSATGTCTIHSNTDCSTFDGVLFRFLAPCTFTLAKTCSSSEALPKFSVDVVNERDGNLSLPAIHQVVVEIGVFRVSLMSQQTRRVVVNGVWKKLPLKLSSDTVMIKSNPAAVSLETTFGLSVSYDKTGAVHISLPPHYSDQVCGFCGNFNHLREDDVRKPDGTDAPDATSLAESWQTGQTASSCEAILVPYHCDPLEEAEYASELYCGGLLSKSGPFAECLSVLGAQSYFRGCLVGMCSSYGDPAVLCETLRSYADICQEAGVAIPAWRNSTFCPLQCGENSYYNQCADGCPEVCTSLDTAGSCGSCVERCECNSGFKLSGGKCVPAGDCGCWHGGKHYEKGENWIEEECMWKCQCMGDDAVKCSSMQCPENEICKVKDGVKGCFPLNVTTCSVYGDPHYVTYDGKAYNFQGGCSYTLTTTCGDESLVQFTVIGHNMHPPLQNFTRSKLEAVTLAVGDLQLTINQSREAYVDDVGIHLPYSKNGPYGVVSVYTNSNYIILETTFGLRMMIDGQNRLFLQVDERFKYELCGLCGTFSEHQDDDFVTPEGQNATGSFEFGDSWRLQSDHDCIIYPNDPKLCDYDEENAAYRECNVLLRDVFNPCHELVHPSIYISSCVYDYCATSGDQQTLCESLKSYVAACQVAGLELPHWQTNTACVCPLNCNFEKNLCGWEQLIQDSFDWTKNSGSTPSNLTGPTKDHTTGAGFYIYIEGDSVTHGDSARLLSSMCHYNGPLCLYFWYHMYGSATAMALNMYLLKSKKATKVWAMKDNQGPQWHPGYIDIRVPGPFQIIVEGIRGSNAQSDVAIDDISIHFGSCSVCDIDCSFDSNLCKWNQMLTDASDRTWQRSSTPTLMTGPSADHTGDGHYLYIEANSATHGDTARLISSECPDSGPQCLQFWYHMYGSADKMGLHVYLLQNRKANAVWWKRNNKGNMWHLAQVDLTATGAFQIIFEGRRGSNDQSDVAIDDVSLYHGHCKAASCPQNSHYTTCIPACSPTCTHLNGPARCNDSDGCEEGCVCDEGFVKKERDCVPIQQCGCVDRNGATHQFNDVWHTDHCIHKCECEKHRDEGRMNCDDEEACVGNAVCLPNEVGNYYCQSTGFNECIVRGDVEYRTFDKMKYDFEGEHSYVLVQTRNLPNIFPEIYIEGINAHTLQYNSDSHHGDSSHEEDHSRRVRDDESQHWAGYYNEEEEEDDDGDDIHDDDSHDDDSDEYSYKLKELKIRVYNHTVELKEKRGLAVDGRRTNPPVSPSPGLNIYERFSRIYLRTDFGLSVEFDGHSSAEIILPRIYRRKVGGLCGNFDSQKQNEWMKPDGSRARSVEEFGDSWRV
ncbi:zonadhesin [Brachionichthys hirsutus]|uniref:zonadhesin n=1 Tax=Brachionichthys hirsutus TaxID=412623 RepID=UPI0036044A38